MNRPIEEVLPIWRQFLRFISMSMDMERRRKMGLEHLSLNWCDQSHQD